MLKRGRNRLRRLAAGEWRGRDSVVPGVVLASLLALALRVPFVGRPAFSDEAGFLLVARRWHGGGSALYGELWLDRPPLLMLFWRTADVLGGVEAARWMGCVVVVVLVLASAWCGWLIGRRRGAHWAAFTAAGLVSTPILAAHEVNGELLAAPLVTLSCALTLFLVRRPVRPRRQASIALLAGAFGIGAVLVKQNFVDALVFAIVLLLCATARGDLSRTHARRILCWGALGALLPAAATAGWVLSTGHSLQEFWYALYGFRSDAMRVIVTQSLSAPAGRLARLIGVGVLSGVLVLSLRYVATIRRMPNADRPLSIAIGSVLGLGYLGMLAGGSYWLHYLIGLVPALAMAAAHLASHSADRRLTRAAFGVVVASAVTTSVVAAASGALAADTTETSVKQYLASAKHDGDTAVIAYGHANVLEEAGLEPGYRYLWSLPTRVLDPDLTLMVRRLSAPGRPTWFVEWESIDAWDIDRHGRLRTAIDRHYRPVARACEVRIYLRDGVQRRLPAELGPIDCLD